MHTKIRQDIKYKEIGIKISKKKEKKVIPNSLNAPIKVYPHFCCMCHMHIRKHQYTNF